ncbi:MAG: FapA family protein [Lachnospiraceae bacterium]|nr:FapA family protein [Lachnospiraceae bacterium]
MSERNGYFKLVLDDEGTSVVIYPPEEGGKKVDLRELEGYLNRKNVSFSTTMLRSAIEKGSENKVLLQRARIPEVNEETSVRTSTDGMQVIFRFYPPTSGGTLVDMEEVKGDLKANGIKVDLDEEAFNRFLSDKQYCKSYVLAKGTPPVEGTDGEIKYLFNTDPSMKPTVNEDGSVDFFHLNTVTACGKDQVVAELIPAVPGEEGCNVFGERLSPRPVNEVHFNHGPNLHVSEDGKQLISDIDGHIDIVQEKIFVSGVLELDNIDTSTGNIENYQGNLLIKGNVTAGFRVQATGDIEIKGVVEGAYVEAGGQITVVRGVNGMEKGVLKAGKNVVVKYIENATVSAGENVTTECIINSKVIAGNGIYVDGKKGFISGGNVRARYLIEAKIIGSDMGGDTVLEVGVDPAVKERLAELKSENESLGKNAKKIQPVLLAMQQKLKKGEKLSPEQMKQVKALSEQLISCQKKFGENQKEINSLAEDLEGADDAVIAVKDVAFAGTRLTISDSTMVLKTAYNYCRFIRKHGEVSMIPFI